MNNKLLFIVNVDWFFVSHRLPIALQAMNEGYEVHLLCTVTNKTEYLEGIGLTVHPFSFSRSGKNTVKEFFSVFKLYKQIKRIKPDLIHLVTIKPVLYGGIVARLLKVPAVVSAISGLGFLFVERAGLRVNFLRYAVLFLYRLAMNHPNQRVIFQNPTDRNILVKAGGVEKNKTSLIRGSGVNLRDYLATPEPDGVPIIVMASRLLKDKGVYEFVAAARIIHSKGVKGRFQLIGEPDTGNLESVSVESVLAWQEEGIVECLGLRSDIAELFSKAHIIVLPSYYAEGLPKVLIEAAASGRAIITTDMPGCRDAIEPGKTGLLIPARDEQALVSVIEQLIEDVSLRQRMGREGRRLAEKEFSIEKIVQAHLDIYKTLEARV
ncbi:MAG: glycosyltransferase family 4 protein [Gammaproteobacteria bacterium]|nr:glycosyltransferase family 4 protein [Gammaproteobacteria bacterium]